MALGVCCSAETSSNEGTLYITQRHLYFHGNGAHFQIEIGSIRSVSSQSPVFPFQPGCVTICPVGSAPRSFLLASNWRRFSRLVLQLCCRHHGLYSVSPSLAQEDTARAFDAVMSSPSILQLPSTETLLKYVPCAFTGLYFESIGTAAFSTNFLIFASSADGIPCHFVLPYSSIQSVSPLRKDKAETMVVKTTLQCSFCLELCVDAAACHQLYEFLDGSLRSCFCYSDDILLQEPRGFVTLFQSLSKDTATVALWSQFFEETGFSHALPRTFDFLKLASVGFLNSFRGNAWMLLSGAWYSLKRNQSEYQKLCDSPAEIDPRLAEEIERDLHRTLPEYIAYQSEVGRNALRRVLVAFARRFPRVGYCQAMNMLTGVFLVFLTEEQAFWLLAETCEKFLPGYFARTMYGAQLDQMVLESLIGKHLLELALVITQRQLRLSILCLPWLLSLFIGVFSWQATLRILDRFYAEGPSVLFQNALGVIYQTQDRMIASAFDEGDLSDILKQQIAAINGSSAAQDELIFLSREKFRSVDMETIFKLRQQFLLPCVHDIARVIEGNVSYGLSTVGRRTLTPENVKYLLGIVYQQYLHLVGFAQGDYTRPLLDKNIFLAFHRALFRKEESKDFSRILFFFPSFKALGLNEFLGIIEEFLETPTAGLFQKYFAIVTTERILEFCEFVLSFYDASEAIAPFETIPLFMQAAFAAAPPDSAGIWEIASRLNCAFWDEFFDVQLKGPFRKKPASR